MCICVYIYIYIVTLRRVITLVYFSDSHDMSLLTPHRRKAPVSTKDHIHTCILITMVWFLILDDSSCELHSVNVA